MVKPKLTYFDAPVSRGEECRLAFAVAGVDFEDVRLVRSAWPELKPKTPYGGLPTLEFPGHPVIAQSNAILVLLGRLYGLHPKDHFEAARQEAVLHSVEELRAQISPTLRMADEAERKQARAVLASTVIPTWAGNIERQIGNGPFFGGKTIQVVDLKLFVVSRWLKSGVLDHIPFTVLDPFPKLNRLHDAVRDDAAVRTWTERTHGNPG